MTISLKYQNFQHNFVKIVMCYTITGSLATHISEVHRLQDAHQRELDFEPFDAVFIRSYVRFFIRFLIFFDFFFVLDVFASKFLQIYFVNHSSVLAAVSPCKNV